MRKVLIALCLGLPAHAAVLTVTAADQPFSPENGSLPKLTFRVSGSGYKGNSCIGSPTLSTTATTTSAAGTYPISISAGSLSCPGNTFTFTPGVLTVYAAGAHPSAQLVPSATKPSGYARTVQSWATLAGAGTIASDGTGDQSAAINAALHYQRSTPFDGSDGNHKTLYFPAGTYAVSAQALTAWGTAVTIVGDGPGLTHFVVTGNSSTYSTGTDVALYTMDVYGGNSTFLNGFRDLSVEILPGNPNAQALLFAATNSGNARNLDLTCYDSECNIGIYTNSVNADGATGPALLRDIRLNGFKASIDEGRHGGFGLTMEGITATAFTGAALVNVSQPTWIRNLLTYGVTPNAVGAYLAQSNFVVMDSFCGNGSTGRYCLDTEGSGTLRTHNVTSSGYDSCLVDNGTNIYPCPAEHYSGTAATLFSSASSPTALSIPFLETPRPDLSTLAAACQLTHDVTALNASLNACSGPTVYMQAAETISGVNSYPHPGDNNTQYISNVHIPASISFIDVNDVTPGTPGFGGKTEINWIVDSASTTPLVISDQGTYGQITWNANRDLALVGSGIPQNLIIGSGAKGNIYIEDVDVNQYTSIRLTCDQHLYGRQVNLEQIGVSHLVADGTGCAPGHKPTIEILGYKTEQPGDFSVNLGQVLTILGGAQGIEWGGFHFAINNPPANGSIIGVSNSDYQGTFLQHVAGGQPASWAHAVAVTNGSSSSTFTFPSPTAENNQGMFYEAAGTSPVVTLGPLFNGRKNAKGN